MKKLFLSVALLGLAAACKSQSTEVTDTSVPAADCATECATTCEGDMKACDGEMKAECAEQKVCPVTGKVMN
jgi:hypothetical protein